MGALRDPPVNWLRLWLCCWLGLLPGSCGAGDACDGSTGTCLAVELALDPAVNPASVQGLTGVTVDLSALPGLMGAKASGYSASQVVMGRVLLPAEVAVELPDLTGPLQVSVQGLASAVTLAGQAAATLSSGAHSRVAVTLSKRLSGATCPAACLLGCKPATSQCYALQPSNLPGPLGGYYPVATAPVIEISGKVYLDTAACAFDDGLNPTLRGQYVGTLIDQAQGPQLCVVGINGLRVLQGGQLIIYTSEESASPNPAIFLSQGEFRVLGTLDARGCRRPTGAQRDPLFAAGAGGYWGAHAGTPASGPSAGQDGDNSSGKAPGGGGGGHATQGGGGGGFSVAAAGAGGAGGATGGTDAMKPLRGGGGGGCATQLMPGAGQGGGGGGAVQISAGTLIEIGGLIDVSGCGALGGQTTLGGCGGGAGGGILLEAPVVQGSGTLAASGGGGAAPGVGASGTVGGPAGGGAGGRSADATPVVAGRGAGAPTPDMGTPAEPGQDGGKDSLRGAGGGGGLGRVRVNAAQSTNLHATVVAVGTSGAPATR